MQDSDQSNGEMPGTNTQLQTQQSAEKTSSPPSTPTIAENAELKTNANETTSLLEQHHQKFDRKYTEDGYILDSKEEVDDAEVIPLTYQPNPEEGGERKRPRSQSQLSLLEEGMDQYNTKVKESPPLLNCKLSERTKEYMVTAKIAFLFAAFVTVVIFFSIHDEVEGYQEVLAVSESLPHFHELPSLRWTSDPVLKFDIHAALDKDFESKSIYNLSYSLVYYDSSGHEVVVEKVYLPLRDAEPDTNTEEWVEYTARIDLPDKKDSNTTYGMLFETSVEELVTFGFNYNTQPQSAHLDVLIGLIILVIVYVLIGFELIHRTVAAMLGAFAVLAVMSAFNERPTLESVMEMVDYETLALLWGMMTIVAIFSETGFFEWCALQSYKIAKGKVWTLISLLCIFGGVVSAFLDNVTTILLLTPVTISLCEVLNLDPRPVLIAEVLFSNIGGTATAVGDPPNVIIISNSDIQDAGINFTKFTLHMSIGIVFCMIAGYFLLRLLYRNKDLRQSDPPEIMALKQEIEVWRRSATNIMVVSREESTVKALLMQKVHQLENTLHNLQYEQKNEDAKEADGWLEIYNEMKEKYQIRDKPLLIKCGCVLAVTIMMFFASSFLKNIKLDIGWIAVIAAIILLIIADVEDFESIMHKVEWATLLFFAALFILMEGLTELGLIDYIGNLVALLIRDVDEQHRLTVAIILILWVSALASSFIDNIPFTTAMVPIIISLSENEELGLPLEPMVWSLAFGACLGGNGTLIGASANVVCAGIAQQHGYPFTFIAFTVVGFPMMLGTVFVAMIYLLICHSAIGWNGPPP